MSENRHLTNAKSAKNEEFYTQGRRTSLATTRDGATWDETTWTYDAYGRLVRNGDTCYTYAHDGLLATVSNAEAFVEYAYTSDRLDAGYTLTLTNGTVFSRTVVRDAYRRALIVAITNSVNGVPVETFTYAYDALGRPITRNADAFGYNARSEVTNAIFHSPISIFHSYGYDEIGNSTNWPANCLNQYVHLPYDGDGNMLSDGVLTLNYDAANRLSSVSSNDVVLASFAYDAKGRRVRKVTPSATYTYFYDGWNLVRETLVTRHSSLVTDYVWGKDISGTLQGAGGIGGLLYETVDGTIYVPCYDNIGHITRYLDSYGNTVASYTYNAFGNLIAQSGLMAEDFAIRFSTKYYDREIGLYYYGYRYYSPDLMRWLNGDPIGEDGGLNLYAFCGNCPLAQLDILGEASISDYVLWNIGYDKSWGLLGPYGLPVPSLGARLQILFYVSGNFAECCKNGKKKTYAIGIVGAEAFLTWGHGKPNRPKGRDRNKPDPYRPGKRKKYDTDPPDSGYRSRSWHVDASLKSSKCPEPGLHFNQLSGVIFLRGSAGMGVGVQVNVQKEFRPGVDLTEGWSATFSGALKVWGGTIDFGGGGNASWTYLRE